MKQVFEKYHTFIAKKQSESAAKFVPVYAVLKPVFGLLKGNVNLVGDIVEPIRGKWDADV